MYWMEGEEEWPRSASLFHRLIRTAVLRLQLAVAKYNCCPTVLLEGDSWAMNSFGLYVHTLKLETISAFKKGEYFSYWSWFWRPNKHWWMSESGQGEALSIYQPTWKCISSASTATNTRKPKTQWMPGSSEGILQVSALQTSPIPFGPLVRKGDLYTFSCPT